MKMATLKTENSLVCLPICNNNNYNNNNNNNNNNNIKCAFIV